MYHFHEILTIVIQYLRLSEQNKKNKKNTLLVLSMTAETFSSQNVFTTSEKHRIMFQQIKSDSQL